ncbi:hypothetical protein [Halovivax sp.]|uniref:EMC6-like membrane protein n=1 Tax=Halovivax sp. TaxID=1935978 RepID=UPI0025BAA897|nr:hypothetical protein [Halovivax sp.]
MSTTTISERREHLRSIGVTASCALLGVAAGVISHQEVGQTPEAATDGVGLAIVLIAILIQYVLVKVSGLYGEDEFGIKHYLFISFMIFAFWFVTWGILLTEAYLS